MQVTRKELTGRNSAASSVVQHNHKAGAVPKYLKVLMKTMVKVGLDENFFLQARQTEWREAEERRIASIPVIVITDHHHQSYHQSQQKSHQDHHY